MKERGGGGEGGSRVLDISDGHWASIRHTGSDVSLDSHFCSSWSNFVHDVASKMYVFQLKDSIFHQIGPSCWQGPFWGFPHFKNITFSPKKRQGPNYVNAKTFLFWRFAK